METIETLDCGHPRSRNPANGVTDGYAITPDDRKICYACADTLQREQIITAGDAGGTYTGYLSGDCKTITTWSGGTLAVVTATRTVRLTRLSHTHGRTILSVHACTPDGRYWYGRSNPGIYIRLRPRKGKGLR